MTGNNGNGHNGNGRSQRLDSWKEIAAYLRRDERTAIRWEKDRGLPVRRVPGGKRQAVFAFTTELEAWLNHEDGQDGVGAANRSNADDSDLLDVGPQPLKPVESTSVDGTAEAVPFPSRHAASDTVALVEEPTAEPPFLTTRHRDQTWLYLAMGLALVAVTWVGVIFAGRRFSQPASSIPIRLDYTLNSVQAFDSENRLLWSHVFSRNLDMDNLHKYGLETEPARLADFRGDGEREVLVPAPYAYTATQFTLPEIDLFSSQGGLLWSYVPNLSFQFGKHSLGGFWTLRDVLVSPPERGNRIWAAFHDGAWANSFVVNLDPISGKDTLRFVNTGATHVLGEVRTDKTFLAVGGFNNESDLGSLAIIDEARPFAASPQTPGTRHECLSCPAGVPDYYFVFPRSELNELQGFHDDGVTMFNIAGKRIEAVKGGVAKEDKAHVHYIIRADQGFRPVALRFNSDYDSLHRKYEKEGKLQHTLENCPERLRPEAVRMWTPSAGWTEIQIPSTPFNQ